MIKYKAGLIQLDVGPNLDHNLTRVKALVGQAAAAGAKLAALPEMMNIVPDGDPAPWAENVPGPTTGYLADLARRYGLWIQGGSLIEARPGGSLPWNTSVLISPDGSLAAVYRKIHLFDLSLDGQERLQESQQFSAGHDIVTADTELGCFGFAVCYDLRFPELYRLMALDGAELIFTPANFTRPTGEHHWESLLRARAIENGCYIIAASQCGRKPGYQAHGHSLAVGPGGELLGCLPDGEGLLMVEIDLAQVAEARRRIPSLANRRDDVYLLTGYSVNKFKV